MPKEFEFGKLETAEEGNRRRALWAERQKARMGAPLAQMPQKAGAAERAGAAREESAEGRGPGAIAARLRAAKAKEAVLAEAAPGGEALAKIRQTQKTMERLKNIYRIINGASGVTVVGLIITFLVMNAQLIFGNLFKAPFIPKLELAEILIIGIIDLILVAILTVLVVFLMIIFKFAEAQKNPLGMTWEVLQYYFKKWFSGD